MLERRHVLVDTSAFFAMSHDREVNHPSAVAISRRLVSERWLVLTTNFLLAEAHALHLTRLGRHHAWAFLERIDRSGMTIVRISRDDERRARAIIELYTDKEFSLVDATSFAVMERLGIQHAFTFDRHFEQYGFTALLP